MDARALWVLRSSLADVLLQQRKQLANMEPSPPPPATNLYDSAVCRLCADEDTNGSHIYAAAPASGDQLGDVINKYLPLKVSNDGKFPCTLCPGCTIQLEATKLFFDLIVDGQKKLQTLLNHQNEKTLLLDECSKEQLESALKLVNPNSSVQSYTVQSDESGEKIFIQILSDGPLFPPDHELSMKLSADKPKKKRGRPPKPPVFEGEQEKVQMPVEEKKIEVEPEPDEIDANGKPRRRIKKPLKYSDVIQGKELDQVFLEEGIHDEEHIMTLDKKEKISLDCDGLQLSEADSTKVCLSTKHKKLGKKTFECEICNRCFQNQSRLDMHRFFHKDSFYQCVTCAQSFESKNSFMLHSQEMQHHEFKVIDSGDNYAQIVLPVTSNEFEDVDEPTESAEPSTSTLETINCNGCEETFTTQQNLDVHHRDTHNNKNAYNCDQCDKQFPFLSIYQQHQMQHDPKTHQCDQCDKVCNHPSSLVYHREAEHNAGRQFVCNKCDKSFKHKQLLLRHQLVHTSERPFSCSECKAAFKTRAHLLNHMPTHTKEKKYFCTECGLCFPYKTSLNLHKRWHNGQKPYECDVCMKTFSQKGNMAEHRRIHTGEKPFCCTYCGRRFTTSSQYKLHVKRHTGERPWRCEYCSKTFLHKDTWRCHTRRHRNERPFQCTFCLRGFTEQWALKKHERLHTGEKPYTCDVCGKSFADSSNLKKHTKIHLNNQNQSTNQLLTKDNVEQSADDNGQVLYLTYNDSTDNQQALEVLQENKAVKAEESTEHLFNEDLIQNMEEISVDVQQLVDNDGNFISITTDDGQQIKVVTTTDDNQCIQGLMPDGTLIPINFSMQDGKPVAEVISNSQIATTSNLQSTSLNSMELLPTYETSYCDKNQVQFLNECGQNLCLITYGLGNSAIAENQFININ